MAKIRRIYAYSVPLREKFSFMKEITCSFCGRKKSEVSILIAGISGHICEDCASQAHAIVSEEAKSRPLPVNEKELELQKPADIKRFIDDFVIGQDDAKKSLSVAVYNHYKRLTQKSSKDSEGVEI